MKFIVRVLSVGFLTFAPSLWAAPDALVFQKSFEAGLVHLEETPAKHKADSAGFEYVLVGGITGDYLMRMGYYETFVKELLARGVPRDQIHLIFPSSKNTVKANADYLDPRLKTIAAQTTRPLVLIGHSKGAVELVQWYATRSELDDRIEGFFSIQGAYGGSPIADLLSTKAHRRARPRGMLNAAGLSVLKTLNTFFHGIIRGVEDITTANSEARLVEWQDSFGARLTRLGQRSVFVRSSQSELRLMDVRTRVGSSFLLAVGSMENDGALPLTHQVIPWLEAPVITVQGMDHGLPCGEFLARRHHFKAIAFIRALLGSLGH